MSKLIIQTVYDGVDKEWVKWWIKNRGGAYPRPPTKRLSKLKTPWFLRSVLDPTNPKVRSITTVEVVE